MLSSFSVMLSSVLVISFISWCTTLDPPDKWGFVIDPYTVKGTMNFTPFLNKTQICEDGLDSICTEDFAEALKQGNQLVHDDDSLRKGCDYDNELQRKVCWIRKMQGGPIGQMKQTKFELQFWYDHKVNKSKCRYNYPHGD
uniref:Uncharacterized protein n=1 Tax=Cacopsylla melanoneura TaxID=428564 RepID=A0A8D8V5M8_9HEMI